MKKLFTFFAAMLIAFVANAQGTDFAAPGYYCAADDAALSGGSSSNFFLETNATPHYITWSDVSLSSNALATWTVTATRGCYVAVSLDLGPVIASNKHNFEVKILDAKSNIKGTVTEGGENTASETVKALDGTILIPTAGTYTVELRNNRDWGKGTIKNVILTYSADAPSELIDVTSVTLNKAEVTLDIQEVELLLATVLPENATDPSVTWKSSDETVATVNENGLINAVAAGTTTITAQAGEMSATCAVTVAAAAIPEVSFAEPYVLAGKVAHLEGAIWKNENYKLYGDGGSNKNYGTASWTINVTKPCSVVGVLNGVEGGHIFQLDVYKGEDLIGTLAQPDGKTWSAGEIALDDTLVFAAAGEYTLKLRNTQEWSSGKVQGVTLTALLEPQTLYLKPGPWYYEGNKEKFAMYAWADGKEAYWSDYMTLAENETDIWTGTIPGGYDKVIFVRFANASTTPSWEDNMWNQTEDLTIEEGKDLYTITKQDPYDEEHKINPKAEGAWSKYEYVAPAKFYVLGLDNKWTEADAVRSDADSYVAELAAGYYEMKILVDGTWATAKGYDDLTEVAAGLSKNQEYGNICFTLAEAGNVTITYTSTVFKLEGNFYVAPATKFYITGDAALVGEDLAWKPNAIPVNEDSYTFENLPAGSYNLKVTLNGTWEGENNIKGFTQLTEPVTVGLTAGENDNIVFTLKEAGDVVVTYTSEVFKVEGNFVPTAIDNTVVEGKAVKVMKDGQLYIIKAGKTYNVLGTQMK